MNYPEWLGELGVRDEAKRAAAGLTPKRDGWYKSIDGRTRYLFKPMPLADALDRLPRRISEIRGGKKIIINDGLTLEQLVELFLEAMYQRLTTGVPKRLRRRTYDDYVETLTGFALLIGPSRVASTIGEGDFSRYMQSMAGKAASTINRRMIYVDRLFNWAGPGKKSRNIIPYAHRGPDWMKPDNVAGAADKAYTPLQVQAAFARAWNARARNPILWPAAHLGLNFAFNAMDVATLPDSVVDLAGGALRWPRGKSNVARVLYMLPQTADALRWYAERRPPADASAEGLFFRTRQGQPLYKVWLRDGDDTDAGMKENALTRRWGKWIGLPFTGLRSFVATVADDWHDQRAVDLLMGHSSGRTGRHVRSRFYAKRVDPNRALMLAEHVWYAAWQQAQSPWPRAEAQE